MKLLDLLDLARREGVVVAVPDGKGFVRPSFEPLGPLEIKLFSQVQPFVFSPSAPKEVTVPEEERKKVLENWKPGYDEEPNLDAPFPVFSIEYLGGEPLDKFKSADEQPAFTECVLVVEILPKQYGYYALTNMGGTRHVWKSNVEGPTVMHVLNRLQKEKLGTENVRYVAKIGSGKNSVLHRIRKVIHVTPKKEATEKYEGLTKNVDWTHRWEVRGHWRKIEGLGKDRGGAYVVDGFTWVSHHEKGPEHLPLVKKTRLVTDEA